METPLVLLATDRAGWTFDRIARQVAGRTSLYYRFKVVPHNRIINESCDVLVALWWAIAIRAKASCKRVGKTVVCVYDGLSWKIDKGSRHQFRLTLRHADALGVCNQGFLDEICKMFSGDLPPVVGLIEDGVDTSLFHRLPMPDRFRVGWTGDSTRWTPGGPSDHKGLSIIKVAARTAEVPLAILDASAASGQPWSIDRMPVFYQDISTYICASYTEGTPNPVLEAMACGRPVISTAVGLVPQLVTDGRNGYIVERSEAAFADAIRRVASLDKPGLNAMGEAAREAVLRYDWEKKIPAWRELLQRALASPPKSSMGSPRPTGDPSSVEIIEPGVQPHDGPPRVLAISDVPGWAFHVNMMDMEEHIAPDFTVEHWHVADFLSDGSIPDMALFDVVFCIYHRWPIMNLLPWNRTVGSLRALWFWPERQRPPAQEEYDLVNRYRKFHVVTRRNYDELREHCPHVVYLTNPVNMSRFPDPVDLGNTVVCSWNGNARHMSGHVDVKGFYTIVVPATAQAGVPLEYAEYHTKRVAVGDMPAFYQRANLALCASLYEGASNSVMEAMASGQALIATDVGNHREMHDAQVSNYGESGILLVERSVAAFSEAIVKLSKDPARVRAMGQLNRQEIQDRWSWDVWADGYKQFLTI